jgi:hypothetical protein
MHLGKRIIIHIFLLAMRIQTFLIIYLLYFIVFKQILIKNISIAFYCLLIVVILTFEQINLFQKLFKKVSEYRKT